MRQKLGLIRGDVDVGGTFRFAGFAGEAQVERLFNVLVLPSAAHHLSLQHFEQHVRAAPGAVFFLKRHHVAGTHRAGIVLAAFPQPNAPYRRLGEGTAVIRKLEMGFGLERLIVRAQTQILGGQVGVDHLVRVHLIVRVPGGLEFDEGLHQLRTEHLGKQRAARLPVAMLAGKRSAITDHQIRSAFDELPIFSNSVFALQIETHAHVDAAVSEMSVERSVVVVFVEQLADIAEVAAQFFRRDGRVVPSLPFGRGARGGGSRTRPGLAQLPNVAGFALRVQADIGRISRLSQLVDEFSGEMIRLAGSSDPNSTSKIPRPSGRSSR